MRFSSATFLVVLTSVTALGLVFLFTGNVSATGFAVLPLENEGTRAGISTIAADGGEVDVWVEFKDDRYKSGDLVKFELFIEPEGVVWGDEEGCFSGVVMGPELSEESSLWSAETVSQDGYFRTETRCRLPSDLDEGSHTLLALPTIFFEKEEAREARI